MVITCIWQHTYLCIRPYSPSLVAIKDGHHQILSQFVCRSEWASNRSRKSHASRKWPNSWTTSRAESRFEIRYDAIKSIRQYSHSRLLGTCKIVTVSDFTKNDDFTVYSCHFEPLWLTKTVTISNMCRECTDAEKVDRRTRSSVSKEPQKVSLL